MICGLMTSRLASPAGWYIIVRLIVDNVEMIQRGKKYNPYSGILNTNYKTDLPARTTTPGYENME